MRFFAGKRKRAVSGFFLMMTVLLCMSGCGREKLHSYTLYTAFDTETNLQFFAKESDAGHIYEVFKTELERYHQLFDIYHDYKDVHNIKTINDNAGIAPVAVDEEIINMLKLSVQIGEKSGGSMNAAMGSVLAIWHDYRMAGLDDPEAAALPAMEELTEAAGHTDIRKLIIDEENNTVYLSDPEMSLDVGAIAKGYAVAKLGELLEKEGVTSGLLDVGGNILAIGSKKDGSLWRIALQNPDLDSEKAYIHVLGLSDTALVTSGDYQRFYTVDGKKYHHIIDADTLMPADYFTSVSVLCKDSGLADALSTALFSMDEQSGRKLAESIGGVEVLWVYKDGHESMTDGFGDYLEE